MDTGAERVLRPSCMTNAKPPVDGSKETGSAPGDAERPWRAHPIVLPNGTQRVLGWNGSHWIFCWYSSGAGAWFAEPDARHRVVITHWMDLPPAPEELS